MKTLCVVAISGSRGGWRLSVANDAHSQAVRLSFRVTDCSPARRLGCCHSLTASLTWASNPRDNAIFSIDLVVHQNPTRTSGVVAPGSLAWVFRPQLGLRFPGPDYTGL